MMDPILNLPPNIWHGQANKNRAGRWPWRGRRWLSAK